LIYTFPLLVFTPLNVSMERSTAYEMQIGHFFPGEKHPNQQELNQGD